MRRGVVLNFKSSRTPFRGMEAAAGIFPDVSGRWCILTSKVHWSRAFRKCRSFRRRGLRARSYDATRRRRSTRRITPERSLYCERTYYFYPTSLAGGRSYANRIIDLVYGRIDDSRRRLCQLVIHNSGRNDTWTRVSPGWSSFTTMKLKDTRKDNSRIRTRAETSPIGG